MWIAIGVIIAVVFVGLCIGILFIVKHNEKINEKRNNIRQINKNALEQLEKDHFIEYRRFVIIDELTNNKNRDCVKYVLLDKVNEKIALIDYSDGEVYQINFKDIVNYDIYKNDSSISVGGCTGNNGVTTIMAALLTAINVVNNLKLIIRINNLANPQITYQVLTVSADSTSSQFKEIISSLQEVCSCLEVIISNNNK